MPKHLFSSLKQLALAPLLVLTPALCGCLPEQQLQVLKCEFDFLQTEPDTTLNGAAAPAFVDACVGRHRSVQHSLDGWPRAYK
jgi:hypothetical protein